MNILATIVASYGLLADSTAVVIGAMVIATLLRPIMGIAPGVLDSQPRLLRRALLTETVGVAVVLGVSVLIGRLYQDIPAGMVFPMSRRRSFCLFCQFLDDLPSIYPHYTTSFRISWACVCQKRLRNGKLLLVLLR